MKVLERVFAGITLIFGAVLLISTAGCGGGGGGGGNQQINITVSPTPASVQATTTQQFSATVTGTANTAVSWSVVENAGGSVNGGGLYTAPATTGTYHLTAQSQADASKTATATITVTTRAVSTAKFTASGIPAAARSTAVDLNIGITVLRATVNRLADGTMPLVLMTVDGEGPMPTTMTAYSDTYGTGITLAQGVVTATLTRGTTVSYTVALVNAIDHLELSPSSPSGNVGDIVPFTFVAKDRAGTVVPTTPSKITWNSSSPAVASINTSGKATLLTAGTTTITVTDTESAKSTSTSLTVNDVPTQWPPANPGPPGPNAEWQTPINTNKDGKNLQNANVFGFSDSAGNYAGASALYTGGSIRMLDASGTVVYTEPSLTTVLVAAGITADKKLVIPCYNEGAVKVYDVATHNVSTYTTLDGKPLTHVITAKVYGNNAVFAGETGVWKFDLTTGKGKFLIATPVRAAGISDQFVYAQRTDSTMFAIDFKGNTHEIGALAAAAYDIAVDPNHDVVLIAGRTGSSGAIYRISKSGTTIGSPISLPGGEQVNGIGSYKDLFTIAPNGAPNAYTLRIK